LHRQHLLARAMQKLLKVIGTLQQRQHGALSAGKANERNAGNQGHRSQSKNDSKQDRQKEPLQGTHEKGKQDTTENRLNPVGVD